MIDKLLIWDIKGRVHLIYIMENLKLKKHSQLVELLGKMSLKEKLAQMTQLSGIFFESGKNTQITGPMKEMGLDKEIIDNTGSILGTSDAKTVIDIQKRFLEKNPHGIPLLFMADVIHGFRTIFPVPLAMSCSWEPDLAEEAAAISAKEASASGLHVSFSPMVDLVRDSRWGRVVESTGEDPYLSSLFAKAFVRGYQGDDLRNDTNRIASCVKHFAAYGAAEAGREYNTVEIGEPCLRQNYLPPYYAAVEEGCQIVMSSFNTVNGVPVTCNKWLLRDILRKEWGFEGAIITDWGAVSELINHGVAEDGREAAKKAIEAGIDIEMATTNFARYAEALIEAGELYESLIDEAVLRILQLKDNLGLFDNPYRGADPIKEKELLLCHEHRNAARRIAAKSMVLLKNDGVLPLSKTINKLAVIGPYTEPINILGCWRCKGKDDEAISLSQGILSKLDGDRVVFAKGCDINDKTDEDISKLLDFDHAIEVAREADVIILALGEHYKMTGEAGSRASITLPGRQNELAEAILNLGKPTAIILFNGRPLETRNLTDKASAILEAWYPGTEGGNAIADILFGDESPSGRLTMSFPYSVGQAPVYYNCLNTGRPKGEDNNTERNTSRYLDIPNAPLYPFGYGLTYTTFKYSNANLNCGTLTPGGKIVLTVTVTNTGEKVGEETVQLYIRDISASISRPVLELKSFKKVCISPGESLDMSFEIGESMLEYYTNDGNKIIEAGKFNAFVGPNSRDLIVLDFNYVRD
mgnify:CR=1 FL=1